MDAMIAIRGEFPEARVIILTTYTGDVQVVRAMKLGANDRTHAAIIGVKRGIIEP